MNCDTLPLFFQPFNHGHKVAKFCYADKVSPCIPNDDGWSTRWEWTVCGSGAVVSPLSLTLESLG